jgi:hypothetical protein
MMTSQIWAMMIAGSFLTLVGIAFLWLRMPIYHWYCRRCKKIVSLGRFHPARCNCGTDSLVAYFCKACASWNTSPSLNWHCNDCSSKFVTLGVEYHRFTRVWRWRNQHA